MQICVSNYNALLRYLLISGPCLSKLSTLVLIILIFPFDLIVLLIIDVLFILFFRKHYPCDNTFGGNPFGVPVPSSRLLHGMRKKMCLESLRKFICQSCGGVLEEGWSVEFKNSTSKDELDVLYCAPDGKKFESMLEVAHYLGLTPTADTTECERSYEFDVSVSGPYDPKRRKTERLSPMNADTRGEEYVMDNLNKNQFSGIKNAVIVGESVYCKKVMDANSEETSGSTSREYNVRIIFLFEFY